jgi:dephospho-CoA kinase
MSAQKTPLIIGLTGSMGMGKSTTTGMFAARGIPTYDADAAVHALYAAGGAAVAPLEAEFPGVTGPDGGIDRGRLRERVAGDETAMKRLEAIVHPLVAMRQRTFLEQAAADGADMVVLDIPLLFEKGGDKRVDVVVVVSAPEEVQRERVMARAQMTQAQFEAILARQTPDAQKRRAADFVIDTGRGLACAEVQVEEVIRLLRQGQRRPKTGLSDKQDP